MPDAVSLRARLAADLAAGKTVSLSAADLADPDVRRDLPRLLEELMAEQKAAPLPPLRVPGFTLLGEIGRGGMSTVYLARQVALDRHVALKVAPQWLTSDRRTQQRLLQEARAMARLSHPNIVAIHDILEVDGAVVIAMDWVDGLTLAQVLQRLPAQPREDDLDVVQQALGGVERQALGSSTVRFLVRVVRDVARAVEHVHRAKLLHLDVKPSNILLRRDGTPLLADFGVVRELDLAASHTRTFAGTPVYAAPEQLERADAAFGPHTDVYGLGMTLYELLARDQPLRQLGLTRVLQDVLAGRIPPLASRMPIAADLANIVHKAISPTPRDRYADAGRFADDLTAFLEHRPVAARPLTRVQRLQRWARYEPWKALLAAVLLVTLPALAGLGLYLWLQLPRIEKVQVAERRAVADQLKHAAFQAYFARSKGEGEPARLLRSAMSHDPGDSSLACLLAMAHEEGDVGTAELIAAHRAQVDAHLGLRLFESKVATKRPFFNDYEVAQLRQSDDPIDKYVLALDRVFVAEDCGVEEAWEEADASLDQAVVAGEGDPLLYGLRAWATRHAGSSARFDAVARLLRARWPDDVTVAAWLFYSHEQWDRAAAVEVATGLRDRAPHDPHCWEMLVGEAARRSDHPAALALVQQARDADVRSPLLTAFELQALAYRDGKDAAERALRETPPEMLTQLRRLSLLRVADPAAALAERKRLLAGDVPSPSLAIWLYRAAHRDCDERPGDLDLAWQQWRRQHPHRRALHWEHLGVLVLRKDATGATRLIEEMQIPRRASGKNLRGICTMVISVQDWTLLARCARRWLTFATSEYLPEASFYAALADLRRGEPTAETYQQLAVATSPRESEWQWWAHALIESAWLRVRPAAPADGRAAKIAQAEVDAYDAFVARLSRPKDSPWNLLVRAEVAFANGRKDDAIRLAERGTQRRHGEPHAPLDVSTLLVEALARYRR